MSPSVQKHVQLRPHLVTTISSAGPAALLRGGAVGSAPVRAQWPFPAWHPAAAGGKAETARILLQEPSLDLLPGTNPALVHVHPEENAQPTGQAARLLLQEVGFGFAFEACRRGTFLELILEGVLHAGTTASDAAHSARVHPFLLPTEQSCAEPRQPVPWAPVAHRDRSHTDQGCPETVLEREI